MGSNSRRRRLGHALAFALLGGPAIANCDPGAVQIEGDFGAARFSVEIADDDSERAEGLMHRTRLPLSSGMLFIYDRPQRLSFWMRNTLIELDMLFLDSEGQIRHIHHRAQPLDETPIDGQASDLLAVLEINGGLARRMGISTGDRVNHPRLGQKGCDDSISSLR